MGNPNISVSAGFDVERSVSGAFTGAFQALGTPLTVNPVIMIIDNQSTVEVILSVDGINTWKSFESGEAIVLDLRGNHGNATNFTVDIGTQFYIKGTGGTGPFNMSILYARS